MQLLLSVVLFFRYFLVTFLRLPLPSTPKSPPSSLPPHQEPHHHDLRRLFGAFDRDKDGNITAAELSETLADLGIYATSRDLAAVIGDERVGVEEFGELCGRIVGDVDGGEEEMREVFDVFDEDGDGFITAEELRVVMVALGMEKGRAVEECRRMIGRVDVNGDGKVDFGEFKVMMMRGGVRISASERLR